MAQQWAHDTRRPVRDRHAGLWAKRCPQREGNAGGAWYPTPREEMLPKNKATTGKAGQETETGSYLNTLIQPCLKAFLHLD